MMVDTGELKAPSDWHPETNKVRLAVYSKLQEEMHELGIVIARCTMQGIDETNPTTGKVNRQELEDEMADVRAMLHLLTDEFSLYINHARMLEKLNHKKAWIDMLR